MDPRPSRPSFQTTRYRLPSKAIAGTWSSTDEGPMTGSSIQNSGERRGSSTAGYADASTTAAGTRISSEPPSKRVATAVLTPCASTHVARPRRKPIPVFRSMK
jgi:hypothetical protein